MARAGDAPDPFLGRVIADRYRLEAALGAGALGLVYRARHLLIDREVAIKPLRRSNDHYRAWFLREARAVNRVNHANIADIYDFGETDDGVAFLVMELLAGDRLSQLIDRGPMGAVKVLGVIEQTAAALARAHDLGVVHRDLKPEHIFLVERGGRRDFVKLIDFGLARMPFEGRLSARGAIMGTPEYMAPEQARGEEAGPQADLYSLGVVFFEAVTGRLPFVADSLSEVLECHCTRLPSHPGALRPDLDPGVATIINRLLEKCPDRRYRDAYHLLDDCKVALRRLSAENPVTEVASEAPRPSDGCSSLDPLAVCALRAALLGRMVAAAHPHGNPPENVERTMDRVWGSVAELSRREGELETVARWDDNLRRRSRELAALIGRRIQGLSQSRSRLFREIAAARDELARLHASRQQAEQALESSRELLGSFGRDIDPGELQRALQAAGQAAAQRQICLEAVAKVKGKIAKWQQSCHSAELQISRHRDQLHRQMARLEADLAAGRPRLVARLREREGLRSALAEAEAVLVQTFAARPECAGLLRELERLVARARAGSLTPAGGG